MFDSGRASSFMPLFSARSTNICIMLSVVLAAVDKSCGTAVLWYEFRRTGCWTTATKIITAKVQNYDDGKEVYLQL